MMRMAYTKNEGHDIEISVNPKTADANLSRSIKRVMLVF